MKKIVVIDGQGGRIGRQIVEELKAACISAEVYAVGTNSIATAAMNKAGSDFAATGENAVLVNCRNANVIVGPIGIIMADALLGEVTPAMAVAVGQSMAKKVLIPVNRCNSIVVGLRELTMADAVHLAVEEIARLCR